jgi:hypothetical protein
MQGQQQQSMQGVNSLRQNINTSNNAPTNIVLNKGESIAKFSELSKPKRKQKSDKNTVSLDI